MAKRRNEHGQARKEEMETLEDVEEEAGIFKKASQDQIKGRRIVTARRPRTSLNNKHAAPASRIQKPTGNPFSGFQGLAGSSESQTESTKPNPFGGFTGLTSSTVSAPSVVTSREKSEAPVNGASIASAFSFVPRDGALKSAGNNSVASAFTSSTLSSMQPNVHGQSYIAPAQKTTSDFEDTSTKGVIKSSAKTYSEAMRELNQRFSSWIKEQIHDNPASTLMDAANEYLNYLEEIEKTHAATKPVENKVESSPTKDPSSSGGFHFGSDAPKTSFSFNAESASAFGAPAQPASSASFNFGAPPPALPDKNEHNDEETVGREEATVVLKGEKDTEGDETCSLEIEKAKLLMFKDSGEWGDKGIHPLKVLIHKNTKKGRVLMRNSTGNVILNAALYKGLKIHVQEKNGKKLGVLMILMIDNQATKCILRVRPEKVLELKNALSTAAAVE